MRNAARSECSARMKVDRNKFRKMFPHLAREMDARQNRIAITSVRSDLHTGEKAPSKKFSQYSPDVIDFLRRCDHEQQAGEVINYLERSKEISREYAQRLKKQLKEKGVRSFGSKKEEDYYLKHGEV